MAFVGTRGIFQKHTNWMLLQVELPIPKDLAWAAMIKRVVGSGLVPHMELESISGLLSFAQTSVFGRIGGGILSPMCAKLRAPSPPASLAE